MEARHGERRPPNGKPTSWTARILAPLALVLAAVAIVVVVGGSLDSSDDDNGSPERVSSSGCQPDEEVEDDVAAGYYVIEAGDDLATVADRTCISIERITRLNEGRIDPQLLPIGGCVNLVPEGCKTLAEEG